MGPRLSKERAERFAYLIDDFERRAADWPNETEEENKMRFESHDNELKDLWAAPIDLSIIAEKRPPPPEVGSRFRAEASLYGWERSATPIARPN